MKNVVTAFVGLVLLASLAQAQDLRDGFKYTSKTGRETFVPRFAGQVKDASCPGAEKIFNFAKENIYNKVHAAWKQTKTCSTVVDVWYSSKENRSQSTYIEGKLERCGLPENLNVKAEQNCNDGTSLKDTKILDVSWRLMRLPSGMEVRWNFGDTDDKASVDNTTDLAQFLSSQKDVISQKMNVLLK